VRATNCGDFDGTKLASPEAVNTDRISWLLYLVGSLLVFGSWVDLVPAGLGWIGWLMALGGWAAGSRQGHTSVSKAEQIEKLDHLRQRTVLTEEEFQQEKRRLLDQP
jgi:hypothetical protein